MTPQFETRASAVAERRVLHNAHPRILRIVEQVAHATGFSVAQIVGRNRSAPLVEARQLAMFEARAAGFSLPKIGRAMDRDHTTVLDGVRAEERRRA